MSFCQWNKEKKWNIKEDKDTFNLGNSSLNMLNGSVLQTSTNSCLGATSEHTMTLRLATGTAT